MISISSSGSFDRTDSFLNRLLHRDIGSLIEGYAQEGVDALAAATPEDTGLTAESWNYEVSQNGSNWTITWTNSNLHEGVPIAILLEFGHGTGTGGYVQGRDYINPAIRPVFESIANKVWEAVTSA